MMDLTLQAFIARVREAYKCIVCDYDLFVDEMKDPFFLCFYLSLFFSSSIKDVYATNKTS